MVKTGYDGDALENVFFMADFVLSIQLKCIYWIVVLTGIVSQSIW